MSDNPKQAVTPCSRPAVLTIAGSDSGGGAGIQADLQTFAAAGVFGTSVITCLTAQNPDGVAAIRPVDAAMVTAQLNAVWEAFPICAVKTGMLYAADIIMAVSVALAHRRPAALVVDPVMVAGSGARLLRDDAVAVMRDRLLPLATVVTPNVPEAEILAEGPISDLAGQRRAAATIAARWKIACILKGGHLLTGGDAVTNVIAWHGRVEDVSEPRVRGGKTHGTGCTFAAALAAAMALGADVLQAAVWAGRAVAVALEQRPAVGRHYPLNWKAIANL